MRFATGLANLLLWSLVALASTQPIAEQPPVIHEFPQISNHIVQLTQERCVLYFHGFKLEREIIWGVPHKIELKNMFVSVELQ